jgi:hypothetical protein
MLVGSAVDAIMFGGRRVVLYDGRRAGRDWDEFSAGHANDLVLNADEFQRVNGAVAALRASGAAAPYLRGRYQVVAQWDDGALQFASGIEGQRGGFDVLGDGFLADLKTTTTVEPSAWTRQCERMHYAEQLVHYARGARISGLSDRLLECVSIGVEVHPPHDVAVMRLTRERMDMANRTLSLWYERLAECERSNAWPGYCQGVVDWDVPAWYDGSPWEECDE